MNGAAIKVNKLVESLSANYPRINFKEANFFSWSPEDKTIYYNYNHSSSIWSLFHEVGHMLCEHKNYSSDIGLLVMEVSAWDKARTLAGQYGIRIDENYIEKCLDSYREWIYRRSSCPVCTQAGVERSTGIYTCINCQNKWKVTSARFCRVYRKTVTTDSL